MTAETETKRTGLAQARLARAFTPEVEEEYAAALRAWRDGPRTAGGSRTVAE
ncbi:hypothetical protein GCM10010246_22530 [Streptomyces cuspidosporus]|uniref:Uncharacterized protein n=1 Tax=Streptomyces cuspidosporus TaxID=66882 RepID=A0ABN3FU20_9ACTN